jgi:serine/threonine protein kinase
MNLGQYRGVKLIGTGGFGKIFQGKSNADGSDVAIKMINLKNISMKLKIKLIISKTSDPSYEGSKYVVMIV